MNEVSMLQTFKRSNVFRHHPGMGGVISLSRAQISGSVQKDGLKLRNEHLSLLSGNQPSKPSWENKRRIATLSVYALQAQIHPGSQTTRLSRKHAPTSDRDVRGRWQFTPDCSTFESLTTNYCLLGHRCGRGFTECTTADRSEGC